MSNIKKKETVEADMAEFETKNTLNDTSSGERLHIGFFGLRNSGKSSLVNALTGQDMSLVSSVKGTTTDAVRKTMELLPLGPVVIIDTPGIDDEGELGQMRVSAAKRILGSCDIAVLVRTMGSPLDPFEKELIESFDKRPIPYLVAENKEDLSSEGNERGSDASRLFPGAAAVIPASAITGKGVTELKNALGDLARKAGAVKKYILADLIGEGDTVVLVTPIDESAPKGRLILPQQMVLREILDCGAMGFVTQHTQLEKTLKSLVKPPALVVTDSQVFPQVAATVPNDIPLTSFSILMARYKGFLVNAVNGAKHIDSLRDGAGILISEGCTHHRQCEDIGTVKLPALLKKHTGKEFELTFSSGRGYPEDMSNIDMVIHCGGCMLTENEMLLRMNEAVSRGLPFTNYGIAIAYMNGILERSTRMLPEIEL